MIIASLVPTILFAHGQEFVADRLTPLLQEAGLRVAGARSGWDAIALLRDGLRPAGAVLNLSLGEAGGIDALSRLLATEHPRVRTVLVLDALHSLTWTTPSGRVCSVAPLMAGTLLSVLRGEGEQDAIAGGDQPLPERRARA